MRTWYQPLPHNRPTHAVIYTCFLSRVDVAQNMLRKLRAQASQSTIEMASSERHSRKSHNPERSLKNSAPATLATHLLHSLCLRAKCWRHKSEW